MAVPNEKEIALALNKDLERGFRMLMDTYKEPVYWHIRRLVVAHDDAEDATQETFVRVFRHFSKFKGECSLTAWIYHIATNEALRLLNRRQEERLSLSATEVEISHLMADEYVDYSDLETVKLQKAILSLPTKQQLAFNLRYYDELSYDEIAAITGSTAVNVKANYHIAKEKIKTYMNSID